MAKQHHKSNTQTTKTRKKESRTTTMSTVNNEKNNNKSTWSNNNNSTNNNNDSGFQWEGPSIFDNNNDHAPAHEVVPPDMIDETNNNINGNSVLSVPMLPGVSMEPIYRQHRSLSFSMGQDPTFFGYDDYSDDDDSNNNNLANNSTTTTTTAAANNSTKVYKNSLETMEEEEEEDEGGKEIAQQRTLLLGEDEFNTNRMRSKSSGAALSILSSSQQDYLSDRYNENNNNNKNDRGSVEQEDKANQAWNGIITTTSSDSQGHMNSNTTTTMTPDPVQRLAEQIEAMQFQQQSVFNNNNNIPPTTSAYPITSMSPHTHPHSHHHPTEIYSHLPPPHTQPYYSNHHHQQQQHEIYQEGKGVALHQLPAETLLYMIEFKAGRTDFFYVIPNNTNNPQQSMPHLGDLVIVEADRGKDLGKIAKENLTPEEILNLKKQQHEQQQEELEENNDHHSSTSSPSSPLSSLSNEQQQGVQEVKLSDIQIKRIYRQALPDEISVLLMKSQDEQRALLLCQQKTKQRKLPMEVVDAEYQWDRRKLTFYFVAERRIDFRELVRELFKIYKTRIWMCAVNPTNTN
ncbi:PSP1 C-terminal conserved region-domain-containing protein [Circinella umbellata]|nr:PSP1 C-terminal conserved region-domain-containing protein [Circinella umbellata]